MEHPRHGIKWSEEETILAYRLYCQMPFYKISDEAKEVVQLSELIGRTPGSVALKMFNLSHFDPELQKRNVNGMGHASKTDEIVFRRFEDDWEGLLYEASLIEEKFRDRYIKFPIGTEKLHSKKERINQQFFRDSVLSSYHTTCCITGIKEPELLIASHIKPWADSDPKTERTNPQNGLCLNALHDKAFDRGLMTVLPNYTLLFSSRLKEMRGNEGIDWLLKFEGQQINMPDRFTPRRDFLEYHNDIIFIP